MVIIFHTEGLDNGKNANLLLKGSMASLEKERVWGEVQEGFRIWDSPSPLHTPRFLCFNYGNLLFSHSCHNLNTEIIQHFQQ